MGRKKTATPHNDDYRLFGLKIAELRDVRNVSQEKIAEELGIPKTTYSGYETGTRKIPLSLLKRLSEYFCISVDELLELEVFRSENDDCDYEADKKPNFVDISLELRLDESELLKDYNSLSDENKYLLRNIVKTFVQSTATTLTQKENA